MRDVVVCARCCANWGANGCRGQVPETAGGKQAATMLANEWSNPDASVSYTGPPFRPEKGREPIQLHAHSSTIAAFGPNKCIKASIGTRQATYLDSIQLTCSPTPALHAPRAQAPQVGSIQLDSTLGPKRGRRGCGCGSVCVCVPTLTPLVVGPPRVGQNRPTNLQSWWPRSINASLANQTQARPPQKQW